MTLSVELASDNRPGLRESARSRFASEFETKYNCVPKWTDSVCLYI
jgi:hypothetical protein